MQGRPLGLSRLTGVPSLRAEEGEELGGLPRDAPPYSCRLESLGPVKHLDWAAGRHGQDDGSAKLKLEPGKADPFPTAPAHGACLPYLGAQGTVHSLRSSPSSHPPRPPPGACASRTSRALRTGTRAQRRPPHPAPSPRGAWTAGSLGQQSSVSRWAATPLRTSCEAF